MSIPTGTKRARSDGMGLVDAPEPRVNPDERYCNYYVSRKHRFCKTERKPGAQYCPTHLTTDETTAGTPADRATEARVPCPINPNHTVFASRLEKHVTVCPDLRFVTSKLSYFVEDKHGGRGEGVYCRKSCTSASSSPTPRVTHRDLSPASRAVLIAKVQSYYHDHVAPQLLHIEDLCTSADTQRLVAASDVISQKHTPQHAALLQCVLYAWQQHVKDDTAAESANTVSAPHSLHSTSAPPSIAAFLELGAGKGGLSVALQRVLTQDDQEEKVPDTAGPTSPTSLSACTARSPRLVVVDFDTFRRKGDARVSHSRLQLERWRINIKDLDLTAALSQSRTTPASSNAASLREPWVALGKHLCGACTDFALSCLTEETLGETAGVAIDAVVLATCCHHRCELRHLNPVKACIPPRSADAIEQEGSVMTDCGEDLTTEAPCIRLPDSNIVLTAREFAALTSMSSWAVSGTAVDAERQEVGFHSKRVIDAFRVAYLREHGFSAHLCVYTSRDVTEENVCLVAWKPAAHEN